MNEQILSPVAERKSQEPRQSGYAAPRIFAAGNAAELIQGNDGPWHDADNRWCKEHK
jgi:hypothetical protein